HPRTVRWSLHFRRWSVLARPCFNRINVFCCRIKVTHTAGSVKNAPTRYVFSATVLFSTSRAFRCCARSISVLVLPYTAISSQHKYSTIACMPSLCLLPNHF
ncbi:unnamed protein product, partial [Laminaria digitata]